MLATTMVKQSTIPKHIKPFFMARVCPKCTGKLTTVTTPVGICVKTQYTCPECGFRADIWDD